MSFCVPAYVFNQLAYLSISTGNALGVPARQVLGFIKSPLNTEIASTGSVAAACFNVSMYAYGNNNVYTCKLTGSRAFVHFQEAHSGTRGVCLPLRKVPQEVVQYESECFCSSSSSSSCSILGKCIFVTPIRVYLVFCVLTSYGLG